MAITYGELPVSAGSRFICCADPSCAEYRNAYSATRGDYWSAVPTLIVRCDACAGPMILAREIRTVEEVAP